MTILLTLLMAAPKPIITIDDGPYYKHHHKTLQLLTKHKVKAIWFVNGHFLWKKQNQKLLKTIVACGHRLGNHTLRHRSPCKLTAAAFKRSLRRNERIVNRVLKRPLNTRMRWYRPPFGHLCHTKLARRLGYRVLLWHDGDIGRTTNQLIRTVLRQHRRKPPRRSILLFHYHNHKLAAVLNKFFPLVSP